MVLYVIDGILNHMKRGTVMADKLKLMCTYELIGMLIIMSFALYNLSVDVIWMDSATYVRTGTSITVNTGEYCTGLKKKEKCRLFYFTSRLCICSRVSHWNWISTQSIRKC